ncbi:CAP domain-containing protein [Mycena sp. CBHHK59/15]|nr:CAP domain-containing protein [Mycena sp. CBHHK59/15]
MRPSNSAWEDHLKFLTFTPSCIGPHLYISLTLRCSRPTLVHTTMIFIVLLALTSLILAAAVPNTPRSISSRHTARSLLNFPTTVAITAYLSAHNTVRAQHGAQDLVWNSTLAANARTWANECQLKHSDGTLLDTPYGENLVAATGNFPISAAVAQFTADESEYDPSNPTYNHFTQVVWKATTQLGCALAHCGGIFDPSLGLASYYVCLYDPPGNVVGTALWVFAFILESQVYTSARANVQV